MIDSGAILEISVKNILHNYFFLKKIANKSIIGVTIKANAYGLGDIEIYKILYKYGCRNFFVATLSEALNLRAYNKYGYIYVLNGINIKEINLCRKKNIIPIINSIEEIKLFNKTLNKKLSIGIHIDTGINRLGIKTKDIKKLNLEKYKIKILLSHLASADESKNKYNRQQKNNFNNILNYINNVELKSFANSMGTMLGKDYHYDIIRPGIAIYGGHYNNKIKKFIKPVVKLKAKVIQIKNLEKNEYVGYNQTYKTNKKLTIAILGIGYADGVSRILSNKGFVYYKNLRFKIIGRVSMDSITIDISNNKKIIKRNMYLDLINYKHDIEKIAIQCNTISNEILTSISNRVKRVYI